ncbi:MAG: hypothetical protein B7X11_05095, partial [Acidobacteria bacterium 37-65-4]
MARGPGIDLAAYFARIGCARRRKPTLAFLNAIVAHHVAAIPFENLDVLLGRPILLDPASLQQKLIRDRRGGYCFEQNGLLLLVLTALGDGARRLGVDHGDRRLRRGHGRQHDAHRQRH